LTSSSFQPIKETEFQYRERDFRATIDLPEIEAKTRKVPRPTVLNMRYKNLIYRYEAPCNSTLDENETPSLEGIGPLHDPVT